MTLPFWIVRLFEAANANALDIVAGDVTRIKSLQIVVICHE
jgi:hypothetical protein